MSLFQAELIPMLAMDLVLGGKGTCPPEERFAVLVTTEWGLLGFQADQPVQIVDCAAGRMVESEKDHKRLGEHSFMHQRYTYPLVKAEVLMTSLTDSAKKPSSTETKEA